MNEATTSLTRAGLARIDEWMKSNPEDRHVRRGFLTFLIRLPQGHGIDLSLLVAGYTGWLKSHPEDTYTRAGFANFLKTQQGPGKGIAEADRKGRNEIVRWLLDDAYPSISDRTNQSMLEAVDVCMDCVAELGSTEAALEVLTAAVEALTRLVLDSRTAPLLGSLTGLYHRAMGAAEREKLSRARAGILEWSDTFASGGSPWLPVPDG